MQDKFEQNIKSRLENHTELPPPMAWDNISDALHPDKPKGMVWTRWVGIAAAIAVPAFFVIGFFVFDTPLQENGNPNVTQTEFNSPPTVGFETNNEARDTSLSRNDVLDNNSITRSDEASALSIGSHEASTNQISRFLNHVFSSNKDYSQNEGFAHTGEVNMLDILTSPFKSDITSEISTPNLFASYIPQNDHVLKVTAFNASEDKIVKRKSGFESSVLPKFSVSPFAGVAALNSLDQPSLIASEFNALEIENQMVTSYGSNLSYQINDRWKVRSGVGVMDMTQNTFDVPMKVVNSSSTNAFNTKSYTNVAIAFDDIDYLNNSYANSESTISSTMNEDISHEIQFVEVPVEVEYAISQGKRVNMSATGGLSTLVLNKNDVYLKDRDIIIAKATNLKSVSFSANAGIKVNYELTDKISINVEPQIKYMLNTVTSNDDVQPYIVGVNAGLSYSL